MNTQLPTLYTQRLVLRKLRREDAPRFFQIASSETVTKYMLWVPHRQLADTEESIEKVLRRYESGESCRFCIALKEADALIGIIDLLAFDPERKCCSFAYMLGDAYWGQGYGTEAVMAVFDYAFGVLGIESITADHFAENIASGAVMAKCGMVYQRTIPGKYQKNDILHDAREYTVTKTQWILQKGSR